MRELSATAVQSAVAAMVIDANCRISPHVLQQMEHCRAEEEQPLAASILGRIIENDRLAAERCVPMCQDTGMAVFRVQLGQELHITGGSLEDAIQEGVRQGYREGYLRKSVVADPVFHRDNTGDNTPAVIYYELTEGDRLTLTFAPKGFGSENMSAVKMLKPADGAEGVKAFVLDAVRHAGPNPCPPIVVGVGIGGTFDKCALLAKRALLREMGTHNGSPFYARLEQELLEKINALGIGPQGFGGRTTALAVQIETMPTHIAGLPCAVNINCHVARHVSEVL